MRFSPLRGNCTRRLALTGGLPPVRGAAWSFLRRARRIGITTNDRPGGSRWFLPWRNCVYRQRGRRRAWNIGGARFHAGRSSATVVLLTQHRFGSPLGPHLSPQCFDGPDEEATGGHEQLPGEVRGRELCLLLCVAYCLEQVPGGSDGRLAAGFASDPHSWFEELTQHACLHLRPRSQPDVGVNLPSLPLEDAYVLDPDLLEPPLQLREQLPDELGEARFVHPVGRVQNEVVGWGEFTKREGGTVKVLPRPLVAALPRAFWTATRNHFILPGLPVGCRAGVAAHPAR